MKLSLVLLVLFLASCMDAADQPIPQQFPNAEYHGNVSGLYAIGPATSGSKAVDFKWRDSLGLVHSLSEYKGRPVVLNFWATSCGFCVDEMPMLDKLQQDRKDIAVIGVSTDNTNHSFKTVLDFAREHHISYQLVVDSTSSLSVNYIALSSGAYALPETFIIGSDGQIQALLLGEQQRSMLDRYLK
jgi:peroxiredoxin